MTKQRLVYHANIGRYVGVDSNGVRVEVDPDAYAEARQFLMKYTNADYHDADWEVSDPDGWNVDMEGFIPPEEHLSS